MPELPDLVLYLEALGARIVGKTLESIRIRSPFLLRTVRPSLDTTFGRRVRELRRLGKRIVICLEEDVFIVLHLMIAGRLHWKGKGAALSGRTSLAAFDFENGTLLLTEAGSRRRAALFLASGEDGLKAHDLGGPIVTQFAQRTDASGEIGRRRLKLFSQN